MDTHLPIASVPTENADNNADNSAAIRLLLEQLAADKAPDKGDRFKSIEAQVSWSGSAIVLPATPAKMSLSEGREWLARLEKADQEEIAISETVDAFPFDGAIALMEALKQVYGWASPVAPRSFFERPPTMLSVAVSPTERVNIIWGRFQIPGIEGSLMTGATMERGRFIFCIKGEIKKKYAEAISQIAELTRKIVKERSIYRGHALRLHVDSDGDLDLNSPPEFVDVSQANRDELVYSAGLMQQIETNLFTPIVHSAACRANRIPLKRGILLEGPYGTGKTLCAYVTAQLAEQHGWTFLMIERTTALKAALEFAAMYQPCVIFCEDIDRTAAGERTAELDDLLNIIDGVSSKGREIMVVLTSNDAAAINRAMMRPGRLDAVLSIQPPDAEAAEKLVRLYGRGLVPAGEDLSGAARELAGQIPAVIRECMERSKLYAISRNPGDAIQLRDGDIVHAAQGMKHHLELLHGKPPADVTPEHALGAALATVMQRALGQTNGTLLHEVALATQQTAEKILSHVE